MRSPAPSGALLLLGCALLLAGTGSVHLRRMNGLAISGRLHSTAAVPRRRTGRMNVASVMWAVVLLAGVAATTLGVLGVAAMVLVGGCGVLVRDLQRRRALERMHRDAVEAVQLMAAELDAGASLPVALRAAAHLDAAHATQFATAAQAVSSGETVVSLLSHPEPSLVGVGHACRIGAASGARLAPVFAALAREASALDERRRAVAAALAGPRSSCVLLALLPVLGTLLGVAIGAHPAEFLLGSPAGRLVCCVGVVLDVLGLLWVHRIVHRAERS